MSRTGVHEHLFWPFPGAFVLRDRNFKRRETAAKPMSISDRLFVAAHDVFSIDPDEESLADFKHWDLFDEEGRDTLGDINGFFYLHPRDPSKPSRSSDASGDVEPVEPREITGWFPAAPIVGVDKGIALPVFDEDLTPDERYDEIEIENKGKRKIKKGELGVLLAGTKEDGEWEKIAVLGGGSGLLAPNETFSAFSAGSDVFDLDGEEEDEEKVAKLQTHLRVIQPRFPDTSRLHFVDSMKPLLESKWFIELEASTKPDEVPPKEIDLRKNSLAIQNGLTGGDEFSFQAKIDNKSWYGTKASLADLLGHKDLDIGPWIGLYGYAAGGPDLCGEIGDIHTLGSTKDGIGISSGHLSHQTLFKMAGGGSHYDATLPFSDSPYPEVIEEHDFFTEGDILFKEKGTHSWMGGSLPGAWKIVVGFPFEESDKKEDETGTGGGGVFSGGGGGGTGAGGGGGGGDSGAPSGTLNPGDDGSDGTERKIYICPPPRIIEPEEEGRHTDPPTSTVFTREDRTGPTFTARSVFETADPSLYRKYLETPFNHSFGGILFKPIPTVFGGPDLSEPGRNSDFEDKEAYRLHSPITGQLFAYGGYALDPDAPTYTQPSWNKNKDFRGGTGPGGTIFLPPEVSREDIRHSNETNIAPRAISEGRASTSSFVLGPSTRLAVGYPDFRDGGLYSATTFEQIDSEKSVFRRHTTSGATKTVDDVLEMPGNSSDPILSYPDFRTEKRFSFQDGTAFTGTFKSSLASSNKEWELPNESGKLVLVNNTNGFITGFKISWNTTNQVIIGPGNCVDDSGTDFIIDDTGFTVDVTSSGLNGLDTGSEQNNQWYYIFVVKNPTTGASGGLLSTSSTSPTLPSGFTLQRLIGAVRNHSGNFLKFYQVGNGNHREVYYLEERSTVTALSGGSATTYTNVDCSSFIPEISEFAQYWMGGSGTIEVRPDSESYTNSVVTRSAGELTFYIPSSSQIIEYKVSAASSGDVAVLGYRYDI